MPIEKIQIIHNFGIISQNHKKQLQERLYKKRRQVLEQLSKSQTAQNESLVLQITEEFVQEYNESSPERKEKLNFRCCQIFEKIKKKLSDKNLDNLSIQLCWAELSQLMQCYSPIQEECMDLLSLSLETSALSVFTIPTLFFLAEAVIYWIRTETVNLPILKVFEIKLFKIGYLTISRIYMHHILDELIDHEELKSHLSIYLKGFDELNSAYSAYPDVLLYLNMISNIGIKLNIKEMNEEATSQPVPYENCSTFVVEAISTFNSLQKAQPVFDNLVESFFSTRTNWVDAALGFKIISECAKSNIDLLYAFLELSVGDSSRSGLETWDWELAGCYIETLARICVNTSSNSIRKLAVLGSHHNVNDALRDSNSQRGKSYGLIDTARIRTGNEDWDWKLRYCSICALVSVKKTLDLNSSCDEFCKICWAILVVLQEDEKNAKVLEAIKVGKINSKSSNIKSSEKKTLFFQGSIFAQFAQQYKSKMTPIEDEEKQSKENAASHPTHKHVKSNQMSKPMKPVMNKTRTTICDEVTRTSLRFKVPDYNERKGLDLKRIVDDQLRKDEMRRVAAEFDEPNA